MHVELGQGFERGKRVYSLLASLWIVVDDDRGSLYPSIRLENPSINQQQATSLSQAGAEERERLPRPADRLCREDVRSSPSSRGPGPGLPPTAALAGIEAKACLSPAMPRPEPKRAPRP